MRAREGGSFPAKLMSLPNLDWSVSYRERGALAQVVLAQVSVAHTAVSAVQCPLTTQVVLAQVSVCKAAVSAVPRPLTTQVVLAQVSVSAVPRPLRTPSSCTSSSTTLLPLSPQGSGPWP